jgi:hypothetical protein
MGMAFSRVFEGLVSRAKIRFGNGGPSAFGSTSKRSVRVHFLGVTWPYGTFSTEST